jgi:beta-lactamase regulating signal transducer with metallopeptidase domain
MYFVFPQAWIASAITAATMSFGHVPVDHIDIKYRNLPRDAIGEAIWPNHILIDKRPEPEWPREKAQCVIVHEYGHLAGHRHKHNPRSIMSPVLRYKPCHRYLVRHGLS